MMVASPNDHQFRKVRVAPSHISQGAKIGLFATQDIKEEETICPYLGETITNEERDRRYGRKSDSHKFIVPHPEHPDRFSIDSNDMEKMLGRYAKGTYNPSGMAVNAQLGGSIHKWGQVDIFALQLIQKGEEILVQFGEEACYH